MLIVGYVTKPHGLKGEVLVHLVTNRLERTQTGTEFVTDRGTLHIEAAAAHGDRWRVQFAGVHSRTAAEALAGTELRAEAFEDPDALWVHDLVDATVELADGSPVGRVESVEANPASDLLVLDTGALVPLRFVVSAVGGRVVIDPPLGLLDDAAAANV